MHCTCQWDVGLNSSPVLTTELSGMGVCVADSAFRQRNQGRWSAFIMRMDAHLNVGITVGNTHSYSTAIMHKLTERNYHIMRIMAIDYGDARTGIAVSDTTLTLTGDAWVVHSKHMEQVAQTICNEAATREVSCIVVGYPKNMDGSIGARAEKSEQLTEILRSLCEIEIKLWDERMTTMSAHRVLTDVGKYGKKRKKTVDAVAASLILENYLTYIKSVPV